MNDDARLERIFADALSQSAPSRAPERLRAAITTSVGQSRPRPRWLALLKEQPMQYTKSVAVGSPMARLSATPARRAVWIMLVVGLTIALAAAALVVGSRVLRDTGPDHLNSVVVVPTLSLEQSWDKATTPDLDQPSGMDVGPDGNLYVVNAGTDEILVLDPKDGHVIRRWGSNGSGPGQFIFHGDVEDPYHSFGGLAVTPEGSVFVMDTENDRVQQFDLMGTFIRQWGGYGTGDGNLILAWDVSDAPDGSLIISDNTLGMVRRFASDGTYQATLADLTSKPGNLSEDTGGTAVGDDGVVYAADGIGRRVQSWAADGTFLRSYGLDNTTNAGLRYPYDVAVDSAGNVYASDTDRIVVYQPDGRLATSWDIPNPFSHSDALNPITIGPDGAVYVSAWRQDTIYRLRTADREIDEPSAPPATPAPSVAPDPSAGHAGSPMVVHGLAVEDTFQVPFTADQPPTWKVNWLSTGGVELAKPDPANSGAIKAAVRVFAPTNAYADACHSANGPVSPPIGPSVDDLVTALTSIPDIRISVPVHDVTIDGHVGKAFDVEAMLTNGPCPDDGAWFPMWTYDQDGTQTFAGPGSNFHQHIAVLDVNGTRVLIESWTFNDTSVTDLVDTQHVFDSIDFQ